LHTYYEPCRVILDTLSGYAKRHRGIDKVGFVGMVDMVNMVDNMHMVDKMNMVDRIDMMNMQML
jgi:hypothetical protein